MGPRTRPGSRATGAGFTLVELLLTVVLLLLLLGAVAFNYSTLQQGAQLDEGTGQLETLFRFARAQASGSGRQVRIYLGEVPGAPAGGTNSAASNETGARAPKVDSAPPSEPDLGDPARAGLGAVSVLWEPDPLGSPGQFVPLNEAATFAERLNESVRVLEMRFADGRKLPPDGAPAAVPAATWANGYSSVADPTAGLAQTNAPAGSEIPPSAQVTFYPDGSSDSVEFVLASQDDADRRQVLVSLSGLTGALRRRQLEIIDGQRAPETAEHTDSGPATGVANAQTSAGVSDNDATPGDATRAVDRDEERSGRPTRRTAK